MLKNIDVFSSVACITLYYLHCAVQTLEKAYQESYHSEIFVEGQDLLYGIDKIS